MKRPVISAAPCKCLLILVAVCLSAWLVGCATSTQPPAADPLEAVQSKGYEVGEAITRIHNFHLTSWIYVNRKSVIISTSPRHKYLVVFTHRCRNLNQASTLITRSVTGQLSRLDFVYVIDGSIDDSIGNPINRERCAVSEIYELAKSTS